MRGVFLVAALALAGCSADLVRTEPGVPARDVDVAAIPGYHLIRAYRPGAPPGQSPDDLTRASLSRLTGPDPVDVLALSGGGDAGAFGAGVLHGWTQRGDRPEFDCVTGVSTGALIAPLAFLGPRHDAALRQFYTRTTVGDVLRLEPLRVLAGASAVGDSAPLREQIARIVSPAMVDEIAAERRKGRLLLIGTTDLDSQRQVIWDIGRIAASGQPDRVDLIRRILLASASVPAAFPPVPIDVVADGRRYQELHVDGSVTHGVFAYPPEVVLPRATGPRRMWVIRNSKLGPEPDTTPARALNIAGRSLSTLIKSQSLSDIDEMRRMADRDGFTFRVTAVPPNLTLPDALPFDPRATDALYRAGLATGRSANGWSRDVTPFLAVAGSGQPPQPRSQEAGRR